MVIRRERGSGWDHPRWPRHTALIAVVLAPVLVGTGVTAHYRVVPADKALAALVVAVLLGIGLERLRSAPTGGGSTLLPVPGWLRRTGSANLTLPPLMSLATAELLAAWSTVWVELGRLPWLGLVAALLPASLAAALWLAAQLRDISAPPANSETGTVAGLSLVRARTLFHGLLVLALAVPLLITLSGLDGAECFLPWLLAPVGEGPLRNTGSQTPGRGGRAVRQLAVLLLASSALLAVGIWAG
jgi:1,4-dihydroxy-2-naphthoate octaprenyltransferase